MSPTPPTVLLEGTFIDALTDRGHDEHERAAGCYADLLDEYAAGRVRLRARADLLDPRERELLAPLERIHVAGQHRRAAARLMTSLPVDEDVALTLVLMRREGIRRIATLDPAFAAFELDVVPAEPDDDLGADADTDADAAVERDGRGVNDAPTSAAPVGSPDGGPPPTSAA